MMRKWFVLVMMLCCAALPARAEGDALFAAGEDKLWQWQDGVLSVQVDDEWEEIARLTDVHALAVGSDVVYCLMGEGARGHVRAISAAGDMVAVYPVGEEIAARQLAVNRSGLFLLAEDSTIYIRALTGDGAFTPLAAEGWENSAIIRFAVDDELLIAQKDGETLSVVDLQAKRLRNNVWSYGLDMTALQLCRAGDETAALALSAELLWQIDLRTGGIMPLARAEDGIVRVGSAYSLPVAKMPGEPAQLQCSGGAVYLWDVRAGKPKQVNVQPYADDYFDSHLVAVGMPDEAYFARAVQQFKQRYPDIQLVIRESEGMYEMTNQLLGGAQGYDLIFTSSGVKAQELRLLGKGVLMDLGGVEEITSLYPEYLDIFGDFCADGAQYAVSVEFEPVLWCANGLLAGKIGISLPEGHWTWSDLFAMGDAVEAYNAANGTAYALLNDVYGDKPYLLDLIECNYDRLSGEEKQALVDGWADLARRGLLSAEGRRTFEACEENAVFTVAYGVRYAQMGEAALLLPPAFDDATRFEMQLTRAMVNANSPHAEAAAYLLACMMQPDALTAIPLDVQGPRLRDETAEYVSWEEANLGYYLESVPISAANDALWRAVIQRAGVAEHIALATDQLREAMPKLRDGELSAAEFVVLLDQGWRENSPE